MPVETAFITIVQRGQGLLAGNAGLQAPRFAALDEFGGVGGQIDGQTRLTVGQNVGLAHQDHRLHLGAGHPQVQKRLMRQSLGGGVITEVLGDPAGHLGDRSGRLSHRAFEPSRRRFDEGFDGIEITFHQRAGMLRAESMFGLNMRRALRRDHRQDVLVDRQPQQQRVRQR